ncbi:sensor histidine kinase [Nocardiopsis ganjiahuensis]|uniref:sensor histidine kinase n=1 Tax=Nocardiopsis ganjiahuensis TaxID=239984 RepID=UPI00034C2E80|nr:histidine kinase [Nocardiopsis ganjiahuensis]
MRQLTAPLTTALHPLVTTHTYQRWAYLIIGGALLMPYLMASLVLSTLIINTNPATTPGATEPTPANIALAALICTTLITATALIPATRPGQLHLARALLTPLDNTPTSSRWRTTLWLHLHLATGMAVCLATMTALTEAALLAIAPLAPGPHPIAQGTLTLFGHTPSTPGWSGPLLALAWVLALIYTISLTGHLLTKAAPHLLGPTPTDRLNAAHAHAHRLAERNRLARELHDSLGHALSVVTLQAATAARLIDTNPDFARQALTHIADTARTATADLDHALGLLREDTTTPTTPPPDLGDLTHLTQATHHTGTDLTCHIHGDLTHIPALLSRETYRIAQEALTNALRHAPRQPLTLTLNTTPGTLTLTVTNPLPPHTPRLPHRRNAGQGLQGMQERAHLIGGTLTAAPTTTHFHLTLHLTWKETP